MSEENVPEQTPEQAPEKAPEETSEMPSVRKQITVMGIIVVGITVVLGVGIMLSEWMR